MNYRKISATAALAVLVPLAFAPDPMLADKASNILRVAGSEDPSSLDPAGGVASTDTAYLYTIYDRLLQFDNETLEPVPMLAKSFEWENDFKTLVLVLNEDVTFHDGAAFDAAAVKTYIEYYKAANRNRDLDPITSVEVRGPYTVALHTDAPYAVLPSVLADRAGMVVSPQAIAEFGHEALGTNPVGAGPFKLVSWEPGNKVEVEAFDAYWREDMPKLSGITFLNIANATARISALMGGQVDFVERIDPVNIPVIERNPNLRYRIDPTLAFSALNLNTAMAPFDDKKVRQALAYSIDREAIGKLSYGADVPASPANLIVPDNYWPSTEELQGTYTYQPETAKALLAEAGHPDGVAFTMCTPPTFASGSVPTDKVSDLMREQMKAAGFTLNLERKASIGACIEAFNGDKAMPALIIGWSGRPAPYMTYSSLLAARSPFNPGGTDYGAGDLLESLKLPATREELEAIYDELNAIWIDEMPWLPIFYTQTVSAFGPDVAGEMPNLAAKWDVTSFYFE